MFAVLLAIRAAKAVRAGALILLQLCDLRVTLSNEQLTVAFIMTRKNGCLHPLECCRVEKIILKLLKIVEQFYKATYLFMD